MTHSGFSGADVTVPILRKQMPELDSVRGVAVLAVVFYHGFAWSYGRNAVSGLPKLFIYTTVPGWLGVNLFFVLSGFLITGILLDSRAKPDYYQSFYTRRCLRILPAYYAILAILLTVGLARWPFVSMSFLYMANMGPFLGIPTDYGVLWSLAVEEHFYLLWPLAVRRLSIRKVTALAWFVVVGTPVVRLVSYLSGHEVGLASYTWCVADGIAMGAILALTARGGDAARPHLFRYAIGAVALSSLILAVGARFGVLTRTRPLGAALQLTQINLACTAVLSVVLLAGTTPRGRLFVDLRVLKFFGYISYGLYLVHLLIFRLYDLIVGRYFPGFAHPNGRFGIMALRFVCVGSGAVAVAYLSRSYYEEWFLRLRNLSLRKENTVPALTPTSSGE
jgi:peptidoglycan/LPS O-acetylase OafA/YrhL